ncbi:hypothetical protein G6F46_001021 [Rhizopus delemar]|uniref:Uncharacterized protein n=3 Tax=Rhizopus TaxID=4842 RepID=I1C3N5_RHIO9|nr:hypothetical protein RO3G_07770 [Rhizopus delemar RA 99-880]KAG1463337.1 hypothetical protein G6F55_002451 [Rhizopus delemar]KAG1553447.1 hypothetical protein G6F51_000595 [Rhizopus arrhizus]KAG1501345.1 hypothetical protein G6F54_003104 [Rhizopus delemar]KAG1518224.1 hypothetical protein G6F53_000753 [Rhizopus delemar]|eukprot:EIE83065.1 hypothetical protein RO3G_07770 [Rhizopus delemar RA 99-880]
MSKQSDIEKDQPQQKENDIHATENTKDLTPLLDSILSLAKSDSQIQPERKTKILQELLNLSDSAFNTIAHSIDFKTWSDDLASDLCKEIQSTKSASKSVSTLLIVAIVYPKIANLNSTASRLLMNSILSLAKEQGRLVIDGLIIPLLFQSMAGRPQFEVISKVVAESLKSSHRFFVLQAILSDGEIYYSHKVDERAVSRHSLRPWNEAIFQLVGSLLSSQPLLALTKEVLQEILHVIRATVEFNPKDKNPMQLLLIITSKHAQAVAEFDCIEAIESILTSSKMFLKRAVLGQLTSIKKNVHSLQESKVA